MPTRRVLTRIVLPCLLALVAAAPAAAIQKVTDPDAPRSLPVDGAVDVRWTDPAQFTDIRYSGNRWEAERGNWVVELAEYLRERALKKLPPGQRLEVEITDIRRAGRYEPWHGVQLQDVRILRDYYPPRMELRFVRTDAQGKVIDQGERILTDPGYMMGSPVVANSSDPLRYEKAMIDRWLTRELAEPVSAR